MIKIRQFEPQDYPEVQKIYQQGIDTGNATFKLKAKSWPEWDTSMLKNSRLVAVENESILGWAALSAVSSRAVYAGVTEVSIYIADEAQGKGIGNLLLSNLVLESESNNIWMLQASIFPENKGSITLHKKNGFRVVGIREKIGQMDGVWRDSVLMERRSSITGV